MSTDLPPDGGSHARAHLAPRTFAFAITGASGALYAMRTMAALLERECHLEVVISDYGRRLLHDELGEAASVSRLREYLVETYGEAAKRAASGGRSRIDHARCRTGFLAAHQPPAIPPPV